MEMPPARVVEAWDLVGAQRLAGGQGVAFRAGVVVLKPVDDPGRCAALGQALSDLQHVADVRFSRPLLSRHDTWVVDGWAAWEWLDGDDRSLECHELLEVSQRFHQAVAEVPAAAARPGRDRWSDADRRAWGEVDGPAAVLLPELVTRRRSVNMPAQLIHGDLAGNVISHDELGPGVIDISPYWRPAAYADAIVIADSVAYGNAGPEIVEEHQRMHGDQLLIRAVLFRVAAAPDEVAVYRTVAEWLTS